MLGTYCRAGGAAYGAGLFRGTDGRRLSAGEWGCGGSRFNRNLVALWPDELVADDAVGRVEVEGVHWGYVVCSGGDELFKEQLARAHDRFVGRSHIVSNGRGAKRLNSHGAGVGRTQAFGSWGEGVSDEHGGHGGREKGINIHGRWAVVFVPLARNVIGRSILDQGHTRLTGFVWSSP